MTAFHVGLAIGLVVGVLLGIVGTWLWLIGRAFHDARTAIDGQTEGRG